MKPLSISSGFFRESQYLINKTSTVQFVVDSTKFTHQNKGFIESFKMTKAIIWTYYFYVKDVEYAVCYRSNKV